jgi:hypothetical protein
MNTFFASQSLLQAFADANACSLIPENRPCKLFTFQNKKIIITASCSSGVNGIHWVNAYECVSADNYFGDKLTYNEHRKAVFEGVRDRGYSNLLISADGIKWVVIGKSFYISPVKEAVQLSIF